ncbi:MAG: tyrosine-type recombinase/integrase [Alphaproteobacteria bacterium]|nr:tyrosine-type recombinase/integrase [Alphaproteobacteria bacterium]
MQRVEGWPHLYRRNNGALYYVRRVPVDLTDVLRERQFKRSLKHRDQRLPAFKAAYDAVHHEVESYIAKLRRGVAAPEAHQAYELAVVRAQRLGFDLRPMAELASDAASVEDLVARLIAVEKAIGDRADRTVDAVLGAVEQPSLTMADALEKYVALHKTDIRDKNENQRRRWRNPLDLAVRNFHAVVGEKALAEITRDDALTFREWWVETRIGTDVRTAVTANKNLMVLRKIFREVNDAYRLGLENPFQGLRISDSTRRERVSLARDWLERVLLTDKALAGLNPQARGVVRVMADTGARVNEVTGLETADIVLEAETPHIILRANSIRSLKTAHSERTIPLVGVALTAMKENPSGFPRYAAKNDSASGAINKYCRENDLFPPNATLYGLRHGFQDRLIEVEAPERIQADLMGHKTLRPKYGKGPSLTQLQSWLEKTALRPDR